MKAMKKNQFGRDESLLVEPLITLENLCSQVEHRTRQVIWIKSNRYFFDGWRENFKK